jgi:hypothetical protein
MTLQVAKTGAANADNQPNVVSTTIKVASAMIAIFCVLNAVDAYTTEVGLSNGGREINVISASFIATFGIEGYIIAKLAASVSFAVVAIVVWRWWHRMNEQVFDFYLVLSIALLAGAAAPVLNNLIVLNGL